MANLLEVTFSGSIIGSPMMIDDNNVQRVIVKALEKEFCNCEVKTKVGESEYPFKGDKKKIKIASIY